ncbi:MAG: glycosyltransferase [Bacteroidales bacterium]|nr:glycosyltransferase [Bacteroidales bacterium]
MKILHIISSLETGGAQKLLSELLPTQKKTDIEVELLVYKRVNSFLEKKIESDGFKIHSLDVDKITSPIIIYKLRHYLKKFKIVHVHLFPCLYQVAIANLGINTNLVYTEHSTHNRRRNHKWLRPIEIYFYKKYKSVICISNQTSINLNEWIKHKDSHTNPKTTTILNGIDLQKINDAKPLSDYEYTDNKLILMVSRFSEAKDQGSLIQSIKYIKDKDVIVAFAGDGKTLESNKTLARELGVSDRCIFFGNRNDVPNIIKTSYIGIQSSHWEGFGLTAIEIMAAGKPVVASDVDGLKQVVEGAGLIFKKGDPMDLADCINRLIEDEDLYRSTSAKCMERAAKYDISKMAAEYSNVYKDVMAR